MERRLSDLKELEELLTFPGVSGHIEQASRLALSLARNAPNENVANLAMKLLDEISARRQRRMTSATRETDLLHLARQLRTALLDARQGNRK